MAKKLRVVHYLNQFFAQLGGEDNASIGIRVIEEPVGPGLKLQDALGDRAEIVATVSCGDNYIAENLEQVTGEILEIIEKYHPDMFFAGPAFNAGRYGVACGSLCTAVKNKLRIPAVTAMYKENPGVDIYAPEIFILKCGDNAREMGEVIQRMVDFAFKMYENKLERLPEKEGFYERGWMIAWKMDKMASTRAVDMVLDKYYNRPFKTEIPLPRKKDVPVPPPIKDLSKATVVFATDGGLYPAGNPDKMPPANAKTFHAYSVEGKDTLNKDDYTIVHNGFDKTFLLADPNRVVPLDAMRELEKEGVVKMHNEFLSTTGLTTNVVNSTKIGKSMAEYVKSHNIDAVILTST
jgi:glycine/betaine/sarcosine/D-proline reductase family selenoprotein B